MSTSSQSVSRGVVSLAELAALPQSPRWTANVYSAEREVVFRMCSNQIPITCPDTVWRQHGFGEVKIWWDDTEKEYKRKKSAGSQETLVLPREREVLKDELEAVLSDQFERYELSRYHDLAKRDMIGQPIKRRLHEEFGVFYNFLCASKEEILSVEGMGEKRYAAIKQEDETEVGSVLRRDLPEESVLVCCPECTEEWKHPLTVSVSQDESVVENEVYCPVCECMDIPDEYIAGPIEFSSRYTN